MTDTLLHPIVFAEVMVNFAARHGMDRADCLLGTDIAPEKFGDAEAMITREQELRLVENLVLGLPDVTAAGFELGLQYSIATFGPWGFAIRTSRNLRSAMNLALRYLPLSTGYCHLSLSDDGETVGLEFDGRDIPLNCREFLVLRDMGTALNLLRELSLSATSVLSFDIVGIGPNEQQRVAELAGIAPNANAKRNAVYIRCDDADRSLPTYDAHLVRMLEDQCKAQLERRQTTGAAGQVRALLLGKLGFVATLEEVAEKLVVSPRTLRRRLDSEATSFRQILEDERRLLAEQMLMSSQVTLDELAIQLGYSDTASFTRAFRRWHGQSPGLFRSTAVTKP